MNSLGSNSLVDTYGQTKMNQKLILSETLSTAQYYKTQARLSEYTEYHMLCQLKTLTAKYQYIAMQKAMNLSL